MKFKFRQKLYLSVLFVFLLFFNGGVFAIVTIQNSKALERQKESFLTQQEYIVQQIVNDMSLIYRARPLGIPLIIEQYGNKYASDGIFMQVMKEDESVYSSAYKLTGEYLEPSDAGKGKRVGEIKTVGGKKYFIAGCSLPGDFENYRISLGFPIQAFFDRWKNTIAIINLVCCAVSAVVAVVLYNLLKTLTKPIQDLNTATIEFGKGNMSARVKNITKDEIGQTAANFNNMARQICTQIQALENSAAEKQHFIDDFSHEMRTPLTAIRGYTQYMQRAKISDDDYYSTLEIIDNQAKRLQNLSENMLRLSLAQTEKIEFELINLKTVFENIYSVYASRAKENNIDFTAECEENIFVKGELSLMESLIGNLTDNAINACKESKKSVRTVKICAYKADGFVIAEVIDNGIGMSEEAVEKIYTPFYREDKARSRKNGGAGLGGSIVKKIADLHKAKIEYISQKDKGTTARIIFTAL